MKSLLLLSLILVFVCNAKETVFVSNNGVNSLNCGTLVDPCQTIEFSVNKSSGGDVFLLSGTHFIDETIQITEDLNLLAYHNTLETKVDLKSLRGGLDLIFMK